MFYADANGSLLDCSFHANHGSIVGGATFSPLGAYFGAWSFDGTDDEITNAPSASINNLASGAMTATAWIFPVSTGEGGGGRIYEKKNGPTGASAGWILLMSGTASFRFLTSNSSGGVLADAVAANNSLVLSQWNHVAATYNRITDGTPRLYVNGVEVSYTTQTSSTTDPGSDASGPLRNADDITSVRCFNGRMDEKAIFNRILSSKEINDLVALGRNQ